MNKESPLSVAYREAKAMHPGMILLFRMGDFYEMFDDDALEVAKVCGLTITHRDKIQMAGFPHHSLEVRLHELLKAGKRVVICDQVDEAPKGEPVKKVVTPTYVTSDFVETFLRERYKADLKSERFANETPEGQKELLDGVRERIRLDFGSLESRILAKDVSLCKNGTFHPSNKWWRRLFHLVTGIKLPRGANATKEIVADYIGRDKIAEEEAAKAKQREEEEAAKEAKKEKAVKDHAESIAAKVKEDKPISGDCLVQLARHLGVYIHPRTVGTLRKRVVEIQSGKSRVYGKGLPQTVYRVYQECRTKLSA